MGGVHHGRKRTAAELSPLPGHLRGRPDGHAGLSQRPGNFSPPGGFHHAHAGGPSPHGGGAGGRGGDDQRGPLRQEIPAQRPAGGEPLRGELHLRQGPPPDHRLPGPDPLPGAAAGLRPHPARLQAGLPLPPPDDREHGGADRREKPGPGGKAGGGLPLHHPGKAPDLPLPPGRGRRQQDLHHPHGPRGPGRIPLR